MLGRLGSGIFSHSPVMLASIFNQEIEKNKNRIQEKTENLRHTRLVVQVMTLSVALATFGQ